jgi:hypothetical protein
MSRRARPIPERARQTGRIGGHVQSTTTDRRQTISRSEPEQSDSVQSETLWIGLAEVAPTADTEELKSTEAAYVHVLGLAPSERVFLDRARGALMERGLLVASFEEVETLDDRLSSGHISEELLDLSKRIDQDKTVVFGTFHAFDAEE